MARFPAVRTGPDHLGRSLTKLVVAILLLNLLVGGMCSLLLWRSYQFAEAKAVLAADNLSRVLDKSLSGFADKIDLTLLAMADEAEHHLRERGSADSSQFERIVGRHAAWLSESDGVAVSDSHGTVEYAWGNADGIGTDISRTGTYLRQSTASSARLAFDQPPAKAGSGHQQIVFSRPYHAADGSFAGVVEIFLPVACLAGFVLPLDLGPKGVVSLWEGGQRLIARYSPLPDPMPTDAEPSAELASLIRADSPAASYRARSGVDGVRRTYFVRRVGRWPLFLVVGMADADSMKQWWQETAALVTLGGLFVLASAAAFMTLLRTQRALRCSEERHRALFEHMQTGLILQELVANDPGHPVDCRILEANPAFLLERGMRRKDVVGRRFRQVWPDPPDDGTDWLAIFAEVARTGGSAHFESFGKESQHWTDVTAYRTAPNQIAVLLADITERKRSEKRIQELAYFDNLTGLPNRRLLMDRLGQALIATTRSRRRGGLLFIDLDNFKMLNDTFGHAQGDQLLCEVGQRLTEAVRQGDTVARLGGDEFVILLEGLGEKSAEAASQIRSVGEKILATLRQPYFLSGHEYQSTASIGATIFDGQCESVGDLLKRADITMYQAKSQGRNTLRFFDPALQAAVSSRLALEEALREAVRKEEFLLYYQPQVDHDRLVGAEALLRWQTPEAGIVSPAEFIPLAEETGLILPLGRWVLKTACRQIAAWAGRAETRDMTVSINVSARQFREPRFVDEVMEVLDETSANPERLKLELTESMLVEDVDDVIAKMTALRRLGLRFSLDDFGTGYSSLSYLKRLPLDQLKIDQSFVRDLSFDPNSKAIAETIVALGRSMDMSVIAEGVEREDQKDFLAHAGCHSYQGYLLGKPLPIEDFERMLAIAPQNLAQ